MKIKQALSALAASVALVSGTGAMAATDGTLATGAGSTSTGTSVVSLNVPDLIKISNLNDITMTQSGTDFVGSDDVCVYRNITGAYGVTAQSGNDPNGAGTAGNFVLADGGGSTVQYSVNWGGTTLTEDTLESGFTNADTTQVDCGGTPNVTVTVTSTQNQVGAATATGTHTDTLSLIVTAE